MNPLFSAVALTLFPEMFPGPLGYSLAGRALKESIWSLETINIRDFATDRHKTVDDSPYGGGAGMVMKPDVLDMAVEAAKTQLAAISSQRPVVIYFTPRGVPINQALAQRFISPAANGQPPTAILVCGRFEGIDQRVIEHHDMLEASLGDFVLSGGEIAALALLDAVVRLLPGVIGNEEAIREESFAETPEFAGLLEYPHYTRPPVWKGRAVPDILLSGNHEQIRVWRLTQAKNITAARRPELMKKD